MYDTELDAASGHDFQTRFRYDPDVQTCFFSGDGLRHVRRFDHSFPLELGRRFIGKQSGRLS